MFCGQDLIPSPLSHKDHPPKRRSLIVLSFIVLAFAIAAFDSTPVTVIASVAVALAIALLVFSDAHKKEAFTTGRPHLMSTQWGFNKLPEELRFKIYALSLIEYRPEQECRDFFPRILTTRALPLDTLPWGPKKRLPTVLKLNPEARAFASKIYYTNAHDIYLGWEHSDPIDELRNWFTLVGDFAIHLRDVRVHISRCLVSYGEEVEYEYTIRVKLSNDGELTVDGFRGVFNEERETSVPGEDYYALTMDLPYLRTYASFMDRRRIRLGQSGGQAIVDFFIAYPEILRWACLGFPRKRVMFFDQLGIPRPRLAICGLDDPAMLVRHF